MKRTFYIIFAIIFIGCANQEKQELDPRIEKFETFLGKEESIALNKLVETFELLLENNFNNSKIEESYKEFVIKMINNELQDFQIDSVIQNRTLDMVEQSGLRYEIYLRPFEVWNDERHIYTKYRYINNADTIDHTPSIGIHKSWSDKVIDSLINNTKKTGFKFNMNGKYMRGLDLIKNQNQDSTIHYYLQDKFPIGEWPATIFAANLNAKKPNYSDYFVKRIIVVELYYIEKIRQLTANNIP
jgi:hypothetical protein